MRSQKAKHVREPMMRVSGAITLLVIEIEIPDFARSTSCV
jgi:hypothetical protein